MQILNVNNKFNNSQYNINKKYNNISFGAKKFYSVEDIMKISSTSPQEVSDGLRKLVNKIKFLNKILGENDKTIKPINTKIGDSDIFINMDKSIKGKTKINIFTYTKGKIFDYDSKTDKYVKREKVNYIRQFLDIILSNKDGRMSHGTISTIDGGWKTFERNPKTGKRSAEGDFFKLIPNINECNEEQKNVYDFGYERNTLTIKNIFLKLFSQLSLVNSDIKLG